MRPRTLERHEGPTLQAGGAKDRCEKTYPGGVGEGTYWCPISQARKLTASNVSGSGPRRAPRPPNATRGKEGRRCATVRTTPSFQKWSRSNEMMSNSRLLSLARPHTAPSDGTNARALCSVRRRFRKGGLGSRSRVISPSSCASRRDVTSRRAAPTAVASPATYRHTKQCEQINSNALPIRHMTDRSPS